MKRLSHCWTKLSSWFPLSSRWVSSCACSGKLFACFWVELQPHNLTQVVRFAILSLNFSSFAFLSFRNKIALDATQALFLLVAEKSMSCMSSSMGEVYTRYSDTDGFLYITYASQEMFGAPQPAARPPCWAWKQIKWTEHWTNGGDTTQPDRGKKGQTEPSWHCFCPVFF